MLSGGPAERFFTSFRKTGINQKDRDKSENRDKGAEWQG
jgi:hypothetical protein